MASSPVPLRPRAAAVHPADLPRESKPTQCAQAPTGPWQEAEILFTKSAFCSALATIVSLGTQSAVQAGSLTRGCAAHDSGHGRRRRDKPSAAQGMHCRPQCARAAAQQQHEPSMAGRPVQRVSVTWAAFRCVPVPLADAPSRRRGRLQGAAGVYCGSKARPAPIAERAIASALSASAAAIGPGKAVGERCRLFRELRYARP